MSQEQTNQNFEMKPIISQEPKLEVAVEELQSTITLSTENSEVFTKEETIINNELKVEEPIINEEVKAEEVKVDEMCSESQENRKRKREDETESKVEESPEKKIKTTNCSQEYHSQSLETTTIVASSQEINCQ
jgi:hypothetical protein